jgi:hypothetical protein
MGELRFTNELKASELAHLKKFLGEDCRDHPEWEAKDLYYIDLEFTEDFGGLKHSGAEKTYDLDKLVNVVIRRMRIEFPDFGLSGSLEAQGERFDDRWTLYIGEDGLAHKKVRPITGQVIECPNCEHKFVLEK